MNKIGTGKLLCTDIHRQEVLLSHRVSFIHMHKMDKPVTISNFVGFICIWYNITSLSLERAYTCSGCAHKSNHTCSCCGHFEWQEKDIGVASRAYTSCIFTAEVCLVKVHVVVVLLDALITF